MKNHLALIAALALGIFVGCSQQKEVVSFYVENFTYSNQASERRESDE